jgi:hypothetical protein
LPWVSSPTPSIRGFELSLVLNQEVQLLVLGQRACREPAQFLAEVVEAGSGSEALVSIVNESRSDNSSGDEAQASDISQQRSQRMPTRPWE